MSYYRHATSDDATLWLNLKNPLNGAGVTGATPEIAIRRIRESKGGGALDGFYYDGAGGFTNVVTWLNMAEFDATNQPGLYTYWFEQSAVGAEHIYLIYFRNTTAPAVGFATEEHIVTDEIIIPASVPAVPVVPGDTVMGRLAAMEDPTTAVPLAMSDAVWDEPLNQHLSSGSTGEALAACTAGTTGSRTVTITIETTGSVPIPGAQIDLYLNGNFLLRGFTNAAGQLVLALDDNSYTVNIFASGFSFTVPEILLVSGDTNITYQGTGLATITPPSSPNLCVVYGTLRDAAGNPHDGICVEVYGVVPQVVSGIQLTERIASTWTDANGFFELELEREARVAVKAEEASIDSIKDVPDAPSQDLATWADAIL